MYEDQPPRQAALLCSVVVASCLSALLAGPLPAFAQPDPKPDQTKSAAGTPGKDDEQSWRRFLRKFEPKDILFLLYKDFEKIEEPDWLVIPTRRWKEFLEQELAKTRPRGGTWSITRFTLDGSLGEKFVRATATVGVRVEGSGGATVDLKLPEANCIAATSSNGEPPSLVRQPGGPYRLIIDKPGVYTYTLELSVEVDRTSSQRRLRLTLPDAPVKKVVLRSAEPLAFVIDGRMNREQPLSEDGAVVNIPLRQEDSLDLAWRTLGDRQGTGFAADSVLGLISYRVEEKSMETEAQLTITTRATSREWVFRLPPGERIDRVQADRGGRSLDLMTETRAEADHTRLEVYFAEPVTGEVQIRIVSQRPLDLPEKPLVAGRIEMENADVQSGKILVFSGSGLWVRTTAQRGLQRIVAAQLEPELRRNQPSHAFRYFGQPAVLELDVAKAQPVLSATSSTSIVVSKTTAEIDTTFQFTISGAQTEQVLLRVPITVGDPRVTGSVPVSIREITVDESSHCQDLVLRLASPTRGELNIRLQATVPMATKNPNVLVLPAPMDKVPCPGSVTVRSTHDVQLALDVSRSRTLLRIPPRAEPPLPAPLWVFQHQQSSPVLTFSLHPRTRTIEATIVSRFRVHDKAIEVDSVLQLQALHEPLRDVSLRVPEGIEGLKVHGTQLIELESTRPGIITYRRIDPTNRYELKVHYRFPISESESDGTESDGTESDGTESDGTESDGTEDLSEIQVPLVLPDGVTVTSYKGTVLCAAKLRAVAFDPWESGRPPAEPLVDPAERASLEVRSSNPPSTLVLRFERSAPLATLVVPRVLIEETLRGDGSRWGWKRMLLAERRREEVEIEMPEGCELLSVHVDGKQVQSVLLAEERRYRIAMPKVDRACSLELEYFATAPALEAWDRVSLAVPALAEPAAIGEVRWLVRVARDRLLIGLTSRYYSDAYWRFAGILRSPVTATDSQLAEQWLVSRAPGVRWTDVPAQSEGRLWSFETWGKADTLEMMSVREPFWVLIWSGLFLVIGLTVSRSRRRLRLRIGFAAAGLAIVLVSLAPRSALWIWLGAQWGVLLVLLAVLSRMVIHHRRRRRYGRPVRRDSEKLAASVSSFLRGLQGRDGSSALPTRVGAAVNPDPHDDKGSGQS